MLATLMAEFGMKIMSGLVVFLLVVGAYLYWKHNIVSEALNKSSAKLEEQSDALLKQKEDEVDKAKKLLLERMHNAIQIYSDHYDDLRAAASRIPERVYINTKTDCSSDAMPGKTEGGSKTQGGIGRTGKAELPNSNIRELDKTIRMIEEMQLKCEYLLNSVE